MSRTTKGLLFFLSIICACTLYNPRSNAVLSSRTFHHGSSKEAPNTLQAIKELRPKRVDWIYYENKDVIDKYKKLKISFSLTINPQVRDSSGRTSEKGRIRTFNDELYVAPWMRKWNITNPYWGCVNSPYFFDIFLNESLFLASLDPYGIFVDDALFNVRLQREKKIGCFCEHCISSYLERYDSIDHQMIKENIYSFRTNKRNISKEFADDYKAFQEQSVISFLQKWKAIVLKKYPKMLFLTNNYNGSWNEIYSQFDVGIAELNQKYVNKKSLDSLYRITDSLQKKQLFTIPSRDTKIQNKILKYNMINNRESIYPWDVFIVDSSSRYYMNLDTIKKIEKEIKKIIKKK